MINVIMKQICGRIPLNEENIKKFGRIALYEKTHGRHQYEWLVVHGDGRVDVKGREVRVYKSLEIKAFRDFREKSKC